MRNPIEKYSLMGIKIRYSNSKNDEFIKYKAKKNEKNNKYLVLKNEPKNKAF